jgi:CheY-like chemotaxis protein/HPt (histidine-containing phosphotransfer) domain-containing protein
MQVQVLVVDDDALSRDVLALLLQRAGYAVETADSGDAALLHLHTTHSQPQVILTDLQMPGTIGKELARGLRGLCGPRTTLLAMSANVPDDELRREFDGFLQKPFTMEALAAAIDTRAIDIRAIDSRTPGAAKASKSQGAAVLDEAVYRKLSESMRPSRLEQLYALCLTDAETRLAKMSQTASNGDEATYKKEAHAIKGSCGMVGATELQTLATSMEERGLRDDHVASHDEFMLACERLRGMLIAHETTQNRASGVSGEDA